MVDEINQPMQVLQFTKTGAWSWAPVRTAWASVKDTGKKGIYSSAAQTAPAVTLTMRRQALTQANALLWRGQQLLITDVRTPDRNSLEVDAVKVRMSACIADANKTPAGDSFPAVLSEQYVNFRQQDPQSENVIGYVLVTPKEIVLRRGSLVAVDGTPYQVLIGHVLDPYRASYEIQRTVDL